MVNVSSKQVAMRESFGEALVEMGKTNNKLVVLDADVSSSTKTGLFGAAYPDRFFNVGVAEANLADVAAGLATAGYRPVISTLHSFWPSNRPTRSATLSATTTCRSSLSVDTPGSPTLSTAQATRP